VVSCEGFCEPLQQIGGLHTSPSSSHVLGELQGRESGPIHEFLSPRRNNQLERMSNRFISVARLATAFHGSKYRLRCVFILRKIRMRLATTRTVWCFPYHSRKTAAPQSADGDIVTVFFQAVISLLNVSQDPWYKVSAICAAKFLSHSELLYQ